MLLRRMKWAAAWLMAFFMVMCSSCKADAPARFQKSYLDLFDTVTTILGYETSPEAFEETAERISTQLAEYDHLYDIYEEYPDLVNLCTINAHPGEILAVDQRIIDLLLLAREIDEISGHRTDAMFGAVLKIWHTAREEGIEHPENARLPEQTALENAENIPGSSFWRLIRINGRCA